MYNQDDHFFNPILDAGCYYITLANMVELHSGKPVSKDLVKVYGLQEVLDARMGNIDSDMTIMKANGVLAKFGSPLVQKLNDKGGVEFPADYVCLPGEFEALKLQYTSKMNVIYGHFVLGDGKGKCFKDPLYNDGAGSNSVKLGKVVSKRIFYVGGKA